MMNRNLRFPKSWTPRSTKDTVPANYCILSIGQVMKALTKKPHGYSLLSYATLPNLFPISMLHTRQSLAHSQVSTDFPVVSLVSHFFLVHTFYDFLQVLSIPI